MVRTVILLTEEDKRWLDEQAAQTGIPMTALIRRAIRFLRSCSPAKGRSLEELLRATSGTWQQGDGLDWQRRERGEW